MDAVNGWQIAVYVSHMWHGEVGRQLQIMRDYIQRHMSSAHCIVDYSFGWDMSLLSCGMWD